MASTSPDTCSHLTLTNGRGQHQGDLPRLLRRMATEIAGLGPDTMILDFVVHDEVDDPGSFFTATVYWLFIVDGVVSAGASVQG